jgi:hypothetical protein
MLRVKWEEVGWGAAMEMERLRRKKRDGKNAREKRRGNRKGSKREGCAERFGGGESDYGARAGGLDWKWGAMGVGFPKVVGDGVIEGMMGGELWG